MPHQPYMPKQPAQPSKPAKLRPVSHGHLPHMSGGGVHQPAGPRTRSAKKRAALRDQQE